MIAKTKNERKQAYREIIALMLKQEHEKAFYALCEMCGSDTGLFILADYKKEAAKVRQGEQSGTWLKDSNVNGGKRQGGE